ncbi:MAG TPA: hypothetical protein VFW35_13650 [Sphingomicrobium sp.]|nr:hypothetical protein [Sphingomicrobium sp.]
MKILLAAIMLSLAVRPPPPAAPAIRAETASLFTSLAGNWSCSGSFANGHRIESTLRFTRRADGAGLSLVHVDRPPNKYRSEEVWAVDKQSGELLSLAWVGLQGSTDWSASLFASDRWSASEITLVQQSMLRPPWTPNRFRYVLLGNFLHVSWERQQDNQWVLGDSLECRRTGGRRREASP